MGDLDSHDRVCRRFARTTGYPVLAVDYRLAPEHPAPAGPDDVVSAIRWLAAHADELGLDASRIAVAGDSAGGSGRSRLPAVTGRGSDIACASFILPLYRPVAVGRRLPSGSKMARSPRSRCR